MPPKLILIRHAEAEHNATENWDILDPALTDTGKQQCEELHDHLQSHCPLAQQVQCIISSPMRRTVQTTLTVLEWLLKRGVPVECNALWQENSDGGCDTGSDLKTIASEFPELDFSRVDPVYPSKAEGTPYEFSRSAILTRGQQALKELYGRPERVIAVVSHSAFLRTAICQKRFANADYRIFTFRGDNTKGELELIEDSATARKGGGMRRSEERHQAMEEWDFPPENIDEVEQ